ncbi:hypothetical protein cyc_02825 [Cyclospora cayetanensis]|uniref:Uncharacterized protein n=1 Tax=Cyclospora cayetanensis TaxID=88456 RepID=A0A1D3D314_9EIME|nr:hypothetical protein cyc_02825 [Cyclospora cayetanensis]
MQVAHEQGPPSGQAAREGGQQRLRNPQKRLFLDGASPKTGNTTQKGEKSTCIDGDADTPHNPQGAPREEGAPFLCAGFPDGPGRLAP